MKKLGFPKSRRLLANSQFRYVLGRKAYAAGSLMVLYAAANESGWPRLGISVSKSCGKATVRNRLKRLVREAFRLNLDNIPQGYDYVAIVRAKWWTSVSGADGPNEAAGKLRFEQVAQLLVGLAKAAADKVP